MRVASSPQTREPDVAIANPAQDDCNGPIGSNGAMIWGRRCPIHGERAKPLERVAAAAHYDCCVCCVCVCGCVLCVGATFSYQTGRTSAKAKWPIFARSGRCLQPTKTFFPVFSVSSYVGYVPASDDLGIFCFVWRCEFSSKFLFVTEKKLTFGRKVFGVPKHKQFWEIQK
jgi:hypothetical protein